MTDSGRPAEFDLDKKWDKVIDLSLRRIVYGSLAAGLASLVLFSKFFECLLADVSEALLHCSEISVAIKMGSCLQKVHLYEGKSVRIRMHADISESRHLTTERALR